MTIIYTPQSYFLVVYDWHSGQVLSFMDSQSEDMLMLYLQLTPCFHGGGVPSAWARHVTPCPSALWGYGNQSALRTWLPSQVDFHVNTAWTCIHGCAQASGRL